MGLVESLYPDRYSRYLIGLADQIFQAHQVWQSQNDLILRSPKVFTVPGVVRELNDFKMCLDESYRWQSRISKIANPTRFRSKDQFGRNLRSRTYNRLVEKSKKNSNEEVDSKERQEVLRDLNLLIFDVVKTIRGIKIYTGPAICIPRLIPDPSETDYALVEAAFGCISQNPQAQFYILTRDMDIPNIISAYNLVRKSRGDLPSSPSLPKPETVAKPE